MANVVGVRFRQAARVYYFDPSGLELHVGDWVVVASARGQALAQVVMAPGQVISSGITEPLKPVLRKATQEDIERASDVQVSEKEALRQCAALVSEMNLPMKVVAAECDLEANFCTLFFRAEERVDFRELVKRLSGQLKMRVEMRQTGPRDAAKLLGGMGRCGRTLCCATFLTELAPVTIKMAKEQNLPLNPAKISGVCGRLLCCLGYEVEGYRRMKKETPQPEATPVEGEREGAATETVPAQGAVAAAPGAPATVVAPASGLAGDPSGQRLEAGPSGQKASPAPAPEGAGYKRRRPRRRRRRGGSPVQAQSGQGPPPGGGDQADPAR